MSVSLDELGEFLRQPSPRAIPDNIRRRRLSGFLGRGLALFGWCFALFGLLFLVIFFPWRLPSELQLDLATVQTAEGTVIASEKTNMSEGGHDGEDGTPVHRMTFEYPHPRQGKVQGVCYRTGSGEQVGKKVPVEFIEASPSACRIKGCRLNAFSYFSSFVAIFPIIGFGLVYFSWRARRRAVGLLRDGAFALGNVTEVNQTNVTVNDKRRYRVTVSLNVGGEELSASYHAYGEEVDLARAHMANGEKVGVLYDPDRPRNMLLAETLLGGK